MKETQDFNSTLQPPAEKKITRGAPPPQPPIPAERMLGIIIPHKKTEDIIRGFDLCDPKNLEITGPMITEDGISKYGIAIKANGQIKILGNMPTPPQGVSLKIDVERNKEEQQKLSEFTTAWKEMLTAISKLPEKERTEIEKILLFIPEISTETDTDYIKEQLAKMADISEEKIELFKQDDPANSIIVDNENQRIIQAKLSNVGKNLQLLENSQITETKF